MLAVRSGIPNDPAHPLKILRIMRLLAAGMLIAAEMAVVTVFLVVGLVPAGAQRFEDLFPVFGRNNRRGWFDPPDREYRSRQTVPWPLRPRRPMRSRRSRSCCSAIRWRTGWPMVRSGPSVTPRKSASIQLDQAPKKSVRKDVFWGCSERSGTLRPAPRATSAAKVTQSEL